MVSRPTITGPRALLAAVLVLTALAYAPQTGAPWVYEDANWLGNIAAAPTEWQIPGRALTMHTYHWTWQGAGLEPKAYRVGNLGLHLTNGLLVYAITAALIPGAAAVWGAGIFLLHPLNSEAVSYVSARADLLSTSFILLAVWLALMSVTVWRWLLIGIALIAAAMSKETGLMGIPLVVLTLLVWRPGLPRGVLFAPLWIGLGAVLGVMWPSLLSWLTITPHVGGTYFTWAEFATLQLTATWHLLSRLVWLRGFSIDHDIIGLSLVWTLAAGLLTVSAVALICWGWRRASLIAWGCAWMLLALLPRFVFRTNEFINEHQLYLALAGLSMCLGAALSQLVAWRPRLLDAAPRLLDAAPCSFLVDLRRQWRQSGLFRRIA